MKLSKLIVTLLGSALMITACESSNPNDGKIPSENGVISLDDIVIDNEEIEDEEEEKIEAKTCKEITAGQCGASLTDLLVGSYIEPNGTYACSFSHSKTFSGLYTVTSDDRTVAQVTHDSETNSFVVKGITPGDAIIRATTDEDEVVLQFVVHCRKAIPMNKIAETLYNTDVFTGMGYGYKLSFTEKSPLGGTLVGTDDFENSFVNFTLSDGVKENIQDGDFGTYKFKINIDRENSSTSRSYTDMYISTTGEKIYMYYTNGLVDIFTSYGLSMYTGSWN